DFYCQVWDTSGDHSDVF
nr:immunoglobulin light chain junction region [Macaca mulatta]MOY06847.1 immunoglobulin light chain junction region [Macaca mulatta]MOY06901.1 immunoglobulin light chain junction region [Macaca mulatta]MOY07364.1 immunoglobulin light chain junction region [Macaca mulatta]MOY09720.1 immunoglobulin light chain junction region [Macaca mulatta]